MNSNTSESLIGEQHTLMERPFRDAKGRIFGVEYKIGQDGFIDWRAMIPHEHLFVNKKNLEKKNLPITDNVSEVGDENLLIKLGGLKYLARIRGYKSVQFDVCESSTERAVVKCSIEWTPNYESVGEIYCGIANATLNNTSDFAQKFLETVASNRAFSLAVRNYLNILVVGYDEIDSSKGAKDLVPTTEEETSLPTPQKTLEKLARNRGFSNFTELKTFLSEKDRGIKFVSLADAKRIADLVPKDVRSINSILAEEPVKT